MGIVEGGRKDPVFMVTGTRALSVVSGVQEAGRCEMVSECVVGRQAMIPSGSIHRQASVQSSNIQGLLLIASGTYLMCLPSDAIEGPGGDQAMKALQAEGNSSSNSAQSLSAAWSWGIVSGAVEPHPILGIQPLHLHRILTQNIVT